MLCICNQVLVTFSQFCDNRPTLLVFSDFGWWVNKMYQEQAGAGPSGSGGQGASELPD